MKTQELNGAIVLIDPGLENDPAKGQGKLAIVNYESLDNKVYVSLETGDEAVYDPEDLLKLKPRAEIVAALMDIDPRLSEREYMDLYKVTLLQDRETPRALGEALQIVQGNPGISDTALQPAFGIHVALDKAHAR